MKPYSLFLIALMSAIIVSPEAQSMQADSTRKLPQVNWVRSRKMDVKHIAIDLRFDWLKKQAYGTTAITFSLLAAADRITLDAGMLSINTITTPKGTLLKFDYNGGDKDDGLAVTLDRSYGAGEDVTISIDYHTNWSGPSDPNSLGGTNGKGLRFFGPTATEPTRRQQVWTLGDPGSNRYWFPGYDYPNDFRTTDIKVTADKKFTVISNGVLTGTKDNGDGTRTFFYEDNMPYANHLTSLVVGEYVDIKQNYNGITLHNYSYPDEAEAAAASVVQLPEMIKYFSDMTGVRYPYPAYSQAFVQDLPWGVGGNGVATQTENMVDDDRTHADFLYLWDDLEGEALAHQWFGNYVTPRDWSHVWLMKGFGRYFSELYDEQKNGSDELNLYSRAWDRNSAYLPTWNSGYRHPLVTKYYDDAVSFINDSYAGFHGAQVLHMLRKYLGDETWWKAIGIFLKTNANKPVTTEDLREAVEAASGEPMDWFFDQWVYKMGHPVFTVTKEYDESKKLLTLRVKQNQKVDPLEPFPMADFFRGKLQVGIDGKIETVWLNPQAENVFTFSSLQKPKLVNFDCGNVWVKELTFEKPVDELLYQLQYDTDITGRRWAMTGLVNYARNEKATSEEKSKIYSGLRQVILSNAYWRFKWQALSQLQGLLAPASQTAPAKLDDATIGMLMTVIKNEKAWFRASALTFLGMTRNPKYADIYIKALDDQSDRVINAAAISLGQSKSPKAFAALAKLVSKPSWKNQSLISALYGLRQLGDPRGYDIAYRALADLTSPHWVLGTPVWDYRIIAAQTIASLGKSSDAYPLLSAGFARAMDENDIHGIFYNTHLITELADPRGQDVFEKLKTKFRDDANAMVAVGQYETQFQEAVKKTKG